MLSFFKKIYLNLTSVEKKLLLIFSLSLLISVFLLVFNFLKNSTIEVPKSGGEIKIGVVGQPENLNPILAKSNADKNLVKLLFAPLSKLADKIEPIPDSNLWRLRLKENIFWSDGKKITSDDIIFTILKIKEAQNESDFYSFWRGIEANRISELEVQFNLGEKYSFFKEVLDNFYIAPKHIFADLPILNWHLSEYNFKPISNGFYKLDSINIEKNGFISNALLKPNEFYLEQKPYTQLNIKFYPDKENLLKAFNTGAIDVLALDDFENLNKIKRPYNLNLFPVSNYYAVFINQSQNLALKEIEVRKAMSLSINRDKLVSDVSNNYFAPVFGPL
ncbi:MAG: ABC transporter substrate-binding protein, partial [Minisyncoccia bacterium]